MKDKCLFLHGDLLGKSVRNESTREGFGRGLLEAGKKNRNIVALSADLSGSTKMNAFKEAFPNRYFEVGIAEQNMAAVASGIAHLGKIPFISSFSIFSPGRNWEQIRTTICVNNANVKIIGSHAGVLTGEDGETHQALEDIAITRALPNMTVIVPADSEQARKATIEIAKTKNPTYLRVEREKTPCFTTAKTPFRIGEAQVLTEGKDIAIIACGHTVYRSLAACEQLNKDRIKAKVINCHTIKPLDEKTIISAAKECGRVITVEDHNIIGGLGGAVAELLSEKCPVPIRRLGAKDMFGESGTPEQLVKKFGIDAEAIAREARSMVGK